MRFLYSLMLGLCLLATGHAATIDVRLSNFRFTPNDITINVGDTVRFSNMEGIHDVRADDGSYGNNAAGPGWVFSRTYNAPGEYRVYCSPHSVPGADINFNMNARITVRTAFSIVQGLNGTWFNTANPGQGFLFDFQTSNSFMFGAWFTFETGPASDPLKLGNANHRWLTMAGNYSGDRVDLRFSNTAGGVFNTPTTTTTTEVGTGVLTFSSCTSASLAFTLTDPPISGVIPLTKALAPFGTGCVTEAPQAGEAPR